jgi:hypothetical protein
MRLIHGDNQVKSRQRLAMITKAFKGEVVRFNDQVDLTSLKQALESQTFWGGERLVVIEGWPSKIVVDYGKNFSNLVIWVGKKIDGRKLGGVTQSQVELYKISPVIFTFLDTLKAETFRQTLRQEAVELVFFLLARRVRYLIMTKDLGGQGLIGVVPFEKNRIVNQARKYTLGQLLDFYDKLLTVEYTIKSGQTSAPLELQLEVLLASWRTEEKCT